MTTGHSIDFELDRCSFYVPNEVMERIERSYLYHRLIGALSFGKRQVGGDLSKAQIYQLFDMVCDEICNESVMVVSATMPGFKHGRLGKFGRDETRPDRCDPHGLQRDFAIAAPEGEQLDL